MALSGVHVACGPAGGFGPGSQGIALRRKPSWSETLTAAGTTTNSAPATTIADGEMTMTVAASADSYVAIGPTPNATTGARVLVLAGKPETFIVAVGDKLAWVAA